MIPRYTRPEMDRIWSDANKYQCWLTVEIAASQALAKFGLVPQSAANAIRDKGAFTVNSDGTFAVDVAKMKAGVRDLTHDLLTIEAEGNYAAAKKMLDTLGVIRPAMQRALDGLKTVPTDIDPINENNE